MPARAAAQHPREHWGKSVGATRNSRHAWPRLVAAAALAAIATCSISIAGAQLPTATAEAHAFFESLWPAAQARGISRALFERTAAEFAPDPDVIELAARQPEHTRSPGAYVAALVTRARIDAG